MMLMLTVGLCCCCLGTSLAMLIDIAIWRGNELGAATGAAEHVSMARVLGRVCRTPRHTHTADRINLF
jgi:hypothetical protein